MNLRYEMKKLDNKSNEVERITGIVWVYKYILACHSLVSLLSVSMPLKKAPRHFDKLLYI